MSTVEKIEKNLVSFEFSVNAEEFESAVEKAYRKNVGKINIQGFRKGKAPRAIIEKFYGSQVFYEDAINLVLPSAYDKAIEENEVDAVAQPEIDVKEFSKDTGVIFTAKVAVKPEFELGQYKGVEVEKVEYAVEDKDIDEEVEKMQNRNARVVSVEDRAAKMGDTVNIDFEGFKDDVPFEGGKGENFDLKLGSGQFIPGFEEQLVDKNVGDEAEVNVTFPEEYHSEDLKGQPARFNVKINSIKFEELPELDDEFAKDVSEFDTLEELKSSIKERLEKANENKAKQELEDKILETICNNTEIDIPEAMIDVKVESMIHDFDTQMQYQGINLQQYMQYTGTTLDSLKEQFKDEAQKRVKTSLVLEKIAQAEKLEVSDSEVEEEYNSVSSQNNMKLEEVKKYIKAEDIKDRKIVEKAIDFVVSNSVIK